MGSPAWWRADSVRRFLAITAGIAGSIVLSPALAGSMQTGPITSQPIGHYEFCKRNPAECSIRPLDRGPLRLTDRIWSDLVAINIAVNAAIEAKSDYELHGREEVWSYPVDGAGDCEDYVLEKRRLLRLTGISLSNLLITVVRKPDGEGHAVLSVRTDQGDYILDNLTDTVKDWDRTNYRYLKRQASNHTGRWVSIRIEDNPMVGAVRQ